ncbi:unnamed protein product, partial [Effrenium voratum]
VAVEFEDATFALSDSIMPLLRLRLESMPPGLQLSARAPESPGRRPRKPELPILGFWGLK